eukprot:scaffold9935_cov159-Ochromonas_danica.AAC.1
MFDENTPIVNAIFREDVPESLDVVSHSLLLCLALPHNDLAVQTTRKGQVIEIASEKEGKMPLRLLKRLSISDRSSLSSKEPKTSRPSLGLHSQSTQSKKTSEHPLKVTHSQTKGQSTTVEQGGEDKQMESLVQWMNHHLSPSLSASEGSLAIAWQADQTMTASQPSDQQTIVEYQSLRELAEKKKELQLRAKGLELSSSASYSSTSFLLEREVEQGRLSHREDCNILLDVGMQESLYELFLCYENQWLAWGLEMTFGHPIQIKRSKGGIQTLKAYLQANLLRGSYEAEQQGKLLTLSEELERKEQAKKFVLKKVLAFVFFLDQARERRLLSQPALFQKDALFKSSRDVIAAFCRLVMKGEGDVFKHLAGIGYTVSFVQKTIDEFDFTVHHLVQDVQDGVRLVRLFENLSHRNDLSSSLRLPAISRLQKIHNIEVCLQALYSPSANAIVGRGLKSKAGKNMPVPSAKQIAEGHQPSILAVLWKMLFTYDLQNLVQVDKVIEHAQKIRRDKRWRRSVYNQEEAKEMAVSVATSVPSGDSENDQMMMVISAPSGEEDQLEGALLLWCQSIAGQYEVLVENFTTSLADGRALCLIVHYYHPKLLPTKRIKKTTYHIKKAKIVDREDLKKALENERKNHLLLRKACNQIGGMPLLLPENIDSQHLPDKRSMTMFLAYMFKRLTETAAQIRSAIMIQRWVRTFIKVQCTDNENRSSRAWRKKVPASHQAEDVLLLSRRQAAALQEELEERIEAAEPVADTISIIEKGVVVLQSIWRAAMARKKFLRFIIALEIIQASFRRKRLIRLMTNCIGNKIIIYQQQKENHLRKQNSAAIVIQGLHKIYVAKQMLSAAKAQRAREEEEARQRANAAVVVIQGLHKIYVAKQLLSAAKAQ